MRLASAMRQIRQRRLYAHLFAGSSSSMLGLALVLLFLVLAVFGPWIVPYPEDARGAVNLGRKLQPPSAAHWFGTDEVGNDIFTRVIVGARLSLLDRPRHHRDRRRRSACRSASWPATRAARCAR